MESIDSELRFILAEFGINEIQSLSINKMGHINTSIVVTTPAKQYLLQQLNGQVFTQPKNLIDNITSVSNYLSQKNYPNPVIKQNLSRDGNYFVEHNGTFWRLIDFISNTISIESGATDEQIKSAAELLGQFHWYLRDFDSRQLKPNLTEFLNLNLRLKQYKNAIAKAPQDRIKNSGPEIEFLKQKLSIIQPFIDLFNNSRFPSQVIHGDPKLSNILFDQNNQNKAVALIDWDTLMAGPRLYDLADMVRTNTHLKSEDDSNQGNCFSLPKFELITNEYQKAFNGQLNEIEKKNINAACLCVVYVQAIRFLTDYLNGNQYYRVEYADQNLNRCRSQLNLFQDMLNKFRILS